MACRNTEIRWSWAVLMFANNSSTISISKDYLLLLQPVSPFRGITAVVNIQTTRTFRYC